MKLYIWNDVYPDRYGAACLYVVADSLEQAKETAKDATVMKYGFNEDGKLGNVSLKEPDRILDVPCGEVYHWEE